MCRFLTRPVRLSQTRPKSVLQSVYMVPQFDPGHLEDDLMTTSAVARQMGVGATSIKRWADAGLLRCVKTAGGHRRFLRSEVERFLRTQIQAMDLDGQPDDPERWFQFLLRDPSVEETQARLLDMRSKLNRWWRVADQFGVVLDRIGSAWATGEIHVLKEHRMAEIIHRALAHCAISIPIVEHPSKILLSTSPGEIHTLGLSLAEISAREAGWEPVWAGRDIPTEALATAIRSNDYQAIALSASVFSSNADRLREVVTYLGTLCRQHEVRLFLGGRGAWPEYPVAAERLSSFEDFSRRLSPS